MTNPGSRRTVTDVADEIRSLASGSSPGERILHDLADQLTGRNRTHLLGVDLPSAYPPDALLVGETSRWYRWTRRAEAWRDALVFVPIVFTWWQLSDALAAYGDYRGPDPFLLAWQRGFGDQVTALSTSAVWVSLLVAVIVALTVLGHWGQARHDREVENAQRRLTVLLAEAGALVRREVVSTSEVSRQDLMSITSTIMRSSESLEATLRSSSADIKAAVDASPGSKLHEMFEKWTAAAGELTDLGTRLRTTQENADLLVAAQGELATMIERVEKGSEDVISSLGRLSETLETERSASYQEAHAHHQVASNVAESTKKLDESLGELRGRADDFTDMVLRMVEVVNRLDGGDGDGAFR